MIKKLVAPALLLGSMVLGATPSFAYTVKNGDTLGKIAEENNLNLKDVVALNPQIENPNLIYVGDNINTVPNTATSVSTNINTNVSVSNSEEDLLARLIEAEAKGEPYAGKVAVGKVVLNRVDSPEFPNSIEGVIYQSGQFSPVSNGAINQPASSESIQASKEALASGGNGNGPLFFYNPSVANSPYLASRETVSYIGNHVFKKVGDGMTREEKIQFIIDSIYEFEGVRLPKENYEKVSDDVLDLEVDWMDHLWTK